MTVSSRVECRANRTTLAGRALVLAVMAAWVTPALADGPWYVAGSVGGLFRETGSWNSSFINFGTGVTGAGVQQETFDPGIIGNLAIGYTILDHVRIEGEFGYGHYQVSKLDPRATPLFPNLNGTDFNRVSGGGVDQYSGTLNAFYDVPIGGPVIPYVGGGLGMLHSELEQGTYRSPAAGFRLLSTSPSAGLAIAEVGVAVPVGGVSIVPAYRYLQTFGEAGSLHEVSAHVVKIGLRYSF